ncbi:coiled-coil domain-containing protein 39 [Chanos chanos]|uniref:Coiled-coil domain-containing protein 39 n=1 Tax=Chanos chanos TaxID=29144 RepID=A0A6J2VIL3_CHACN|nr:coiled-coil domain-containing protein 39 [Chanos chanos]
MFNAVLSEMNWDDRFAIPVANAENKALLDEIQRKLKERSSIENKSAEHKDRINAMTEHLKNVRQELGHTQALCAAKERETESELHFRALADREEGRLRQEIGQLKSELEALSEKKNSHENTIFKTSQKLTELQNQLNWDQQALDAWLEESAQKEEDIMAIIKYTQQDEGRIRELTQRIEKMNLEVIQKRKAREDELTETITAQISLDKTAERLHQANVERKELLRQWESTIEQMRRRDEEMRQCALRLAEVKQSIRERNSLIKEKKSFLENEVENNKEYERKIAVAERQTAKLRQQAQEQERNRFRLQNELESLKGTVDRAATDVEALRSQLTNMKKDTKDKTAKLDEARHHNAALREKLETVTEAALGGEERAVQMEQVVKEYEQNIKEIETQLLRQREALFKKSQELQVLRAREKGAEADVLGSRAALSNLDSQLSKLNKNVLKQQQFIYSQDFQIQRLEKKMSHLQGEENTEEKQALEKRVSELSQALEEKKRDASMLNTQLKKLQDDIRCVRKETEKAAADKNDLTTKIEELQLFNDLSDKELKKLRVIKQDTMVKKNILNLELKRLRGLLDDRTDGVLSLERRRMQLQNAMKDREEEIKEHRTMLCKQIRYSEEERQRLSADLHERLSRTDKLRNRYEILTASMTRPEGEEDKSECYYIAKVALEKEELKQKGDQLDAKIQKAEKEIQALENTLHVLNSCNTTYRKSLKKVQESSEEYQEKMKLEAQKRAADEKYRCRRQQIRELQEDIQGMKNMLDRLLQDEAMQRDKMDESQSHILSLNKELSSQKEKLERATKQCSKLTREIRSAKKTKSETFEERDIELRELRDLSKSVNKMLVEIMEEHPDLKSLLEMYFTEANLPLPSPASTPDSRQSSKISSARSSGSLRSSGSSDGSRPKPPSVRFPSVKMVELGLGLSVTSPPLSDTSPRGSGPPSSRSSSSSRSSIKSSQWKSP